MTSPPNGGNCTIRGATRRRHADGRLLMLQNPHLYPWCHAPSLASCSLTGVMIPHWCRTARRAPINAGGESPTETGPGYRRPAPRRRLLPIRRYTRSGRFNPNRSGGPLPIEPTPLTLPCSRTTPIRWIPPNGANPPSAMQARKHNDGRRKRTSPPTPPAARQRHRRLRQQCQGRSRDQHVLSFNSVSWP